MQRWNGWGADEVDYPLSEQAHIYLIEHIGRGAPTPDAKFSEVIQKVPTSRLPDHKLVTKEPDDRLRHSRGQSLPDWIALRSGNELLFPDGVAYPSSERDIQDILKFAKEIDLVIIPFGGGTSVVGHINPLTGDRPVLTVDMRGLEQLHSIDEQSYLATFGAGIRGPVLESKLNRLGFTMGHFPQSFEFSTLGGWIATRSSGQQSAYYGRIEDIFAGGRVETPRGSLALPPHPASAAGPDLRQLVLGSEGRIGMISQATVRIRPLPKNQVFRAIMFHDFESGINAVKRIKQEQIPVSMLRLSDSSETEANFALAGRDKLTGWVNKGFCLVGYGPERCLLIYGLIGSSKSIRLSGGAIRSIAKKFGGLPIGNFVGKQWFKSRFHTPYLRNTLWTLGYAVDTLETASNWSEVPKMILEIRRSMEGAAVKNHERIIVLSHLSHLYRDGSSIYITYIFRRGSTSNDTMSFWQELKRAASQVIVSRGGTISHHHGIGIDHAPYMVHEKGQLGINILSGIQKTIDPGGILNPGKLGIDN